MDINNPLCNPTYRFAERQHFRRVSVSFYKRGDYLFFCGTSQTSKPLAFRRGRICLGTTASTMKAPVSECLFVGFWESGRTRIMSMGIARSCLSPPGDDVRISTIANLDASAAGALFSSALPAAGVLVQDGQIPTNVSVISMMSIIPLRMASVAPFLSVSGGNRKWNGIRLWFLSRRRLCC